MAPGALFSGVDGGIVLLTDPGPTPIPDPDDDEDEREFYKDPVLFSSVLGITIESVVTFALIVLVAFAWEKIIAINKIKIKIYI